MGFLSPWFLAGAVALGLPVYLHLLRRHSSTPRPFSSLRFFEQRTQSSIKYRRLRYLVLLALRLALLALLVLAFANPFIRRPPGGMGRGKLMLLVIDNSFSMRAGSRLADAKREASNVLASRGSGERAQVMTLGSHLEAQTQPIEDPAALRAAVEGIAPGDSRGTFAELARGLRSLTANVPGPIELHLFSDMQKSEMPATFAEMALPANVSLVLHPVAKAAAPNWAVESVNAPGRVWDPKKVRVQAVIAGYNTQQAARTASLVVNGKVLATRKVDVPAGGRASVEFDSLDVPYGFSRCEVRIDSADILPADDASLFAVERSDPLPVLFLHEPGDTRSPLYFDAALSAGGESAFKMESVSVDQGANLQPSKYAFVVLSDTPSLPSPLENNLLSYVRGGGGILVAAGMSTGRRSRIPIIDARIAQAHFYASGGDHYLAVGDTDPSHPSIANTDRWSGVKFYYAAAADEAGSRVVARLTDGTPLLLDKKIGEGRVLLFDSGLDNLTNDLPLHPDFVPFVEESAFYLSGAERRGGARLVGSFLELRGARERAVGVELIDPDGQRPLSLSQATTAQVYQVRRAGFYQVRLANGRQNLIGVNADRRESDLAVMPDEILSLWAGNRGSQSAQASAAEDPDTKNTPYGLWWYVMLFVLTAAVVESWVANRYLGVRREGP
jgi:Aerotolerance regulator N-terminal/von Willebrand factor type A domain